MRTVEVMYCILASLHLSLVLLIKHKLMICVFFLEPDIAEEPSTSDRLPNNVAKIYGDPRMHLQVDEDDYLLPNSPNQPPRSDMAAYLDLINQGDSPIGNENSHQ